MAHRFPIECLLQYAEDDPSTHEVTMHLFTAGRVSFDPDPQRAGRRIYFFETLAQQQEALSKNPIGDRVFVGPTDVVDDEDMQAMDAAVDRRLRFWGLITDDQAEGAAGPAERDHGPQEAPEPKVSAHARKLAQEHGLDPEMIQGTGRDGTVTKADVERAVQQIKDQAA